MSTRLPGRRRTTGSRDAPHEPRARRDRLRERLRRPVPGHDRAATCRRSRPRQRGVRHRPGQAARRGRTLRRRSRPSRPRGRHRGRRRRARADEHERARAAREGGARGRPARARREADGHLAAGGGRAPRARGGRAGWPRLRTAHASQPDLPSRPRRRAGGRGRRPPHRPRPLRLGQAPGGTSGSTPQAAGRSSISASTTSPAFAPSSARRGA